MESDWEVEIGGGAAVIETDWPGFIDLRAYPGRIGQVAEAAVFPPLARLLLALNADTSPFWTSKCDVWEPEPAALACYIDLLPCEGRVFAVWQHAEVLCRECVAHLTANLAKRSGKEHGEDCRVGPESGAMAESSITMVIRRAVAGDAEGFGITAYLSSKAARPPDAATTLAYAMAAFADALLPATPPASPGSKLK
jgi:hypothetical protein